MDTILLVEDDRNLSFIMKRLLESRGFSVLTALSVAEAKEILTKNSFDLVLLDMMLPDGEGIELCSYIRQESVCPIIFVSCLNDNMSKITALQMGGDDYITKPVHYEELITRIQANIRRAKQYNLGKSEAEVLQFGALQVKKKKREVWLTEEGAPETQVELSPIEYALLLCLIEHEGTLVLYEDLYQSVWKAEGMGDVRTVMVHVSNLRKKLGNCGKNLIHTVRGAGYIFNT